LVFEEIEQASMNGIKSIGFGLISLSKVLEEFLTEVELFNVAI